MADYTKQSVFQPSIPKHLITDDDRNFIEGFGITIISDGEDKFFLYAEDWFSSELLDDDDLFERFQEIICRSNSELSCITVESAYGCSKMRPDGFGGSAVFITATDVRYCSTGQWLEEQISAVEEETGDNEYNLYVSGNREIHQKPVVGIVLDGGLVRSVVSTQPLDVEFIIIDYDTDTIDADDPTLGIVLQQDGSTAEAYITRIKVESPTIDLGGVSDFVSGKAYGSSQQAIAVWGGYPCDGCDDINLDGGKGCANEQKCLAWLHYHDHQI